MMFNNAAVEMRQETCCSCHMTFFMPESFYKQCQEKKPNKSFYCPAGHSMHYTGETDLQKERRARQRAEQEKARLEQEAADAQAAQQRAERALKLHKKRAAAGTCPCCQRTFQNMARHMKAEHPEFVEGTGAKVVQLKSKAA